jgi:hypothetical protein
MVSSSVVIFLIRLSKPSFQAARFSPLSAHELEGRFSALAKNAEQRQSSAARSTKKTLFSRAGKKRPPQFFSYCLSSFPRRDNDVQLLDLGDGGRDGRLCGERVRRKAGRHSGKRGRQEVESNRERERESEE